MNSYYSKETFLASNPMFYKDIDYDMSDIVKTSITKDGNLIELKISHSNKEIIHACLENITANINASQKNITGPFIESKKNGLSLIEEKLKLAEQFHEQLNDKQIKNMKTIEQRFATDVLYANIERKSFPSEELGLLLGLFLGGMLGFFASLFKNMKM